MNEAPIPLDTEVPPPFGTLVVHRGAEAVFAIDDLRRGGCNDCVYYDHCYRKRTGGTDRINCYGGVFITKQHYLELRLLGEVT